MSIISKIAVNDQDLVGSLHEFFKALLEKGDVDALLVSRHLPVQNSVMPALVTDPEKLEGADPFAPVFPINAAKILSRLTRKESGSKIAAVLRPCEIRAFIELVKLRQGRMDEVTLIGIDCPGAYSNVDYPRFSGAKGAGSTNDFCRKALSGEGTAFEDFDISPACKSCDHPVPDNADLLIGIYGSDLKDHIVACANTPRGEDLLQNLGLPRGSESADRKKVIQDLMTERIKYRDRMFEETSEATSDIGKLSAYLANCVNCYNCRVACPVCYCRECVFVTDVFDHEPSQYLRWAKRKGVLKMPSDTVFYHMTRLAHMSTACIGCGQCSNACPNDIPVMELFRTVSSYSQKAFGYEPGRSIDDEPPLSIFKEEEYPEVTG